MLTVPTIPEATALSALRSACVSAKKISTQSRDDATLCLPPHMFKFATYSDIGNGRTRGRQVATLSIVKPLEVTRNKTAYPRQCRYIRHRCPGSSVRAAFAKTAARIFLTKMFTINGKLFSSSDSVSRYASSSRALHSSSLSIRSIIALPYIFEYCADALVELFRHYEDLRCTYAALKRPLARTSLLLSSASSIGHSLVEPFLPQAADSCVKAVIIRRRFLTLSLMASIF